MRKDFGVKPYTYPQPVLIIGTYGEDGTANAMNAAWGGISEADQISICVDDTHKTAENVVARGAFTVSMGTVDQLNACDYVGIVSGNEMPNKLEKTGWHIVQSAFVDAPLFAELPMTLECKLISYEKETCTLIGEIVNVSADEAILDANGNIDPRKLNPIVFDPVHAVYYNLGEIVGNAFSDGAALQ